MREILFKAKRFDTGEWVEGYYTCNKKHYIGTVETEHYCVPGIKWNEVNPDTICQYTGLTGKNGSKIWENDVIKHPSDEKYTQIKFGTYRNCSRTACHVGFYVDWRNDECLRKDLGYWINLVNAEIAGNVFDNPELLKGIRKDEP